MQSSFMSEYGTNFLLFAQCVDVISDGVFNFVVVVPFIFRILVQYETFLLGHKDLLL